MDKSTYDHWFENLRDTLESSYLAADQPWQQSGFSGPYERWESLRRPIADAIDRDGAFLDIGCANGYLLECVLRWTAQRGINLQPFGLDLSHRLLELARHRLPRYADNLFHGNAFTWQSPRQFDFVRTELCYVPGPCHRQYVQRLIDHFVAPGARLLVAEYRSRKSPTTGPYVDDELRQLGFSPDDHVQAIDQRYGGLTRVAIVHKPTT